MASAIRSLYKIIKIGELLAHLLDSTSISLELSDEISVASRDCRRGRNSWLHLFKLKMCCYLHLETLEIVEQIAKLVLYSKLLLDSLPRFFLLPSGSAEMVAVVDMWEVIELVSKSIGEVVKMKFDTAS